MLIVELVSWIVFLSGFVWSLNAADNIFTYIILVIIFILLFWLSQFWIKDTIAGLIFRSSSRFTEGDIIQSEDYRGIIRRFRNHTLEIESRDGKTMFIPYSKLLKTTQIQSQSKDKQSGYAFRLVCSAGIESTELKKQIKKFIITLPWTSTLKKPIVTLINETDEVKEYEVTVYPIDKSHAGKIEGFVKEEFEVAGSK